MFLSWHAKKLADTHPRVPFPVWFKVLAAVAFNAHTYKKTNSVLFELKSKCAHSCSPVAAHRGDDLVCIRPIEKQLQKVGTLVELFWNPFLPNHFGTKIRVFAEWYWKRFGIKLDALRGRFGIGSEPVTRIVLKLFYENRNTADAHYLLPLRCLE